MQKGSTLPLVSVLLFLIGLLAASIYYYYQATANISKNSPTPQSSAQIQKDETSDWKTYTNKRVGFEFKYPKSFTIGVFNQNNIVPIITGNEDNVTLIVYKKGKHSVSEGTPDYYLSFSPYNGSLVDLVLSSDTPLLFKSDLCPRKTQKKDLQINKITTLWIRSDYSEAPACRDVFFFIKEEHGFLLKTNIGLTDEEEKEYIEPLLSTFRFLH